MKIRLFLLLLFVPVVIFGQRRTADEAKVLAEQFLNNYQGEYPVSIHRLSVAEYPVDSLYASAMQRRDTDNVEQYGVPYSDAPFYMFNDSLNGRFVLVSGDERMTAVLGYSDQGVFDYSSAPDAMLQLMRQYIEEFAFLQSFTSVCDVKHQSAAIQPISPLLSTKWSQTTPYNKHLPYIGGEQAVTGCVATAMAQIMNYYEYPTVGIGQHSYVSNGEDIFQDFSATSFDWASMRDDYNDSYTEAEAAAVATLMRCCGVAVNTNYEVAGAFNYDVPYALRTYFGYNDNIVYYDKSYFSDEEWHGIIYEELNAGRPVYYSGVGSGGHAFVLDGCDTSGLYHINWGWGGTYDGYFSLSALIPIHHHDYTSKQYMVCRIAPETFGEEESVFYASFFSPTLDVVQENSTANFQISGCTCYSNRTSYGQNVKEDWTISLALYDDQFEYIKILDSYTTTIASNYSCGSINLGFIPAEANLVEGKSYYIAPVVSREGSEKITHIRTLQNKADYSEICLSGGKLRMYRQDTFEQDELLFRIADESQKSVKLIRIISDMPSVTIPQSVTHKGVEYAVTAIEDGVFSGLINLQSVEILAKIKRIGKKTFYSCSNLMSIVIPDCVTSIGSEAFSFCYSLGAVELPDSLKSIGNDAFVLCKCLTSIVIPDGVKSIGNDAFSSCFNLGVVEFLGSVDNIGRCAFYNCTELTAIKLPQGLVSIGNRAFYGCSGLIVLEIPSSVESIGDAVFIECNSLRDIYALPIVAVPSDFFMFSSSIYDSATLHIPEGSESSYSSTYPWSEFVNVQIIPTGIEDMPAADDRKDMPTYNLNGVRVESDDNLPNGLYIRNGTIFYVR